MPEFRKILGQLAPAATTWETLYSNPGTTDTVSSSFVVCNRSNAENSYFRLAVIEDGAGAPTNTDYIYYDVVVLPNDTFMAKLGITTNQNDSYRVYASTANLTFSLFGVQIT